MYKKYYNDNFKKISTYSNIESMIHSKKKCNEPNHLALINKYHYLLYIFK